MLTEWLLELVELPVALADYDLFNRNRNKQEKKFSVIHEEKTESSDTKMTITDQLCSEPFFTTKTFAYHIFFTFYFYLVRRYNQRNMKYQQKLIHVMSSYNYHFMV